MIETNKYGKRDNLGRFISGPRPKRIDRIEVSCSNCNMKIIRLDCKIKGRKNIFCNQKCKAEWQVNNLVGKKNTFYGKTHTNKTINKLRASAKKRCCIPSNNPSYGKFGEEAHGWKGGSNDYYHMEARRIMGYYISRKLKEGEVVHHLDHNIKNNQIDNLYLFHTGGEHSKYHWIKIRFVKEMLKGET